MLYSKLTIFILAPFIAAIIAAGALKSVKIKPSLSGAEKELSAFSFDAVKAVVTRQPAAVTAADSPIEIPRTTVAKKSFPGMPLSQIAPQHPPAVRVKESVTFILTKKDRKMAIINGIVVKEGDMINGGKVVKIQKNRVLLQDGEGDRWLSID